MVHRRRTVTASTKHRDVEGDVSLGDRGAVVREGDEHAVSVLEVRVDAVDLGAPRKCWRDNEPAGTHVAIKGDSPRAGIQLYRTRRAAATLDAKFAGNDIWIHVGPQHTRNLE